MQVQLSNTRTPQLDCIPAADLPVQISGATVCVAGLVLVRQRPGTAKGVIFITLEDETGVVNVVIWQTLYDKFRRAVIAGRMLKVTGRLQKENEILHVIAQDVQDISYLLDIIPDISDPPCTSP